LSSGMPSELPHAAASAKLASKYSRIVKVLAFSTAGVNQATFAPVGSELQPVFSSTGGLILAVLLGLLWGSFANVCIYRLPADKSVVTPGSHCGSCGKAVRWYDNVPILSYLWLRG